MNKFDQGFFSSDKIFMSMLYAHRKSMRAGNRKRTENFVNPVWIYPSQYERKYRKQISAWMKESTTLVNEILADNLDNWINEYNENTKVDTNPFRLVPKPVIRSDEFEKYITCEHNDNSIVPELNKKLGIFKTKLDSDLKTDEYSRNLKEFTDRLYKQRDKLFITQEQEVRRFISTIGFEVSDWNSKEWKKQTKKLLGVPFIVPEAWEAEVIAVWQEKNFALIKSLNEEYIKKVNFIVSDGVTSGLNSKEIKTQIKKTNKNITGARSNLIARDQVGKLNGQLQSKRQQQAGVDMYIWLTAGDERVRKKHVNLDKTINQWGNGSVYSNDGKIWISRNSRQTKAEPGQDIQCRCNGLPYFDEMIAIVDEQIRIEQESQFLARASGF